MTIYEIYSAVNFLLAKDKNGNAYSPSDFNIAIKAINEQLYTRELEKLLVKTEDGRLKVIDDERAEIQHFRKTDSLPLGVLPTDYIQWISVKTDGKLADVVTPTIYDSYNTNVLRPLVAEFPSCVFFQGQIVPTDSHDLTYFRRATTPFMDYCVDSNGDIVFMPVGSTISGSNLILNGNTIASGITHLNGITTSRTVELDWREKFHYEFIAPLVQWGMTNLRQQ